MRFLINTLPEELLERIFNFLDHPPRSQTRAREEPTLALLTAPKDQQSIKSVSCVNKTFRRIVFSLLFKHLKLRLDNPDQAQVNRWSSCSFCSENALRRRCPRGNHGLSFHRYNSQNVDLYHQWQAVTSPLHDFLGWNTLHDGDPDSNLAGSYIRHDDEMTWRNVVEWVPRMYHGLSDLLTFVQEHNLVGKIESVLVATGRMLPHNSLRGFPRQQSADRNWRYRAALFFWNHLFCVISPATVSILASPDDLACLTTCVIEAEGNWASNDRDFHLLTLTQDIMSLDPNGNMDWDTSVPVNRLRDETFDSPLGQFPEHSVFNLRLWGSVLLNEGSFLNSYGTYEFFETGGPSIMHGITQHLHSNIVYHGENGLATVRHFTYVAVFPYIDHANFRQLMDTVETLDYQLAPLPTSGILDDPARVGKADLQDCWHEVIQIYQGVAQLLATRRLTTPLPPGNNEGIPVLKTFICRDVAISGLRRDLDDSFVPLCLPCWAEMEPGVFKRLPIPGDPDRNLVLRRRA